MISNINKRELYVIFFGIMSGVLLSLCYSILSSLRVDEPLIKDISEVRKIKYVPLETDNDVVEVVLGLFNFDSLNESMSSETEEGLLSKLDNIKIKLVAQANIANQQHTLLEVTTPKDTVQILVQEGAVVNGVLVKSIHKKQLIIEKDGVEYVVKLFHPKEIN